MDLPLRRHNLFAFSQRDGFEGFVRADLSDVPAACLGTIGTQSNAARF
jgi:hypothetical protein